MTIKHNEMVKVLAKSGATIAAEITPEDAHLLHMALGFIGETSELLECVNNSEVDPENFLEELGDIEFYLEGYRQGLGILRSPYDLGAHSTTLKDEGIKLSILAGTLLDWTKKAVIYRKKLDVFSIAETLQKIEISLNSIRIAGNVTYQQTLDANIAKLGKRYEGLVYSDKAAQDRADKSE